jgi:hypothetical protein
LNALKDFRKLLAELHELETNLAKCIQDVAVDLYGITELIDAISGVKRPIDRFEKPNPFSGGYAQF